MSDSDIENDDVPVLPPGVPAYSCRSCGRLTWWAVTAGNGKRILMDAGRDPKHGWVVSGTAPSGAPKVRRALPLFDTRDIPRYESHWATCPQGEQWKTAKNKP